MAPGHALHYSNAKFGTFNAVLVINGSHVWTLHKLRVRDLPIRYGGAINNHTFTKPNKHFEFIFHAKLFLLGLH
jgi:hypothetical protein